LLMTFGTTLVYLDTYFVNFVHEMYQYYLRMAPLGPKHVVV
jgi:hypothetical protein